MGGKETTKKLGAGDGGAPVGTAALLAPLLAYEGEERVRKGYELFQKLYKKELSNIWGAVVAQHLRYESCSAAAPHPYIRYTYTVRPEHCSLTGFLSGGCVATLFDDATSSVVYMLGRGGGGGGEGGNKLGGWFLAAVSRVLSVTYLRPCRVGDELRIEAEVVQIGHALATTRASIRRVSNDALIATAEHQHFNSEAAAPKL